MSYKSCDNSSVTRGLIYLGLRQGLFQHFMERKGLKKTNTILTLAISEWKWSSSGEPEKDHENETVLPVVSNKDFGF